MSQGYFCLEAAALADPQEDPDEALTLTLTLAAPPAAIHGDLVSAPRAER
jgi:hypothetical protein